MTTQLPLQLQLRPVATFANFVAGDNSEAIGAVEAIAEGRGEPYLYLWGRQGSGRTHLAQAACSRAQKRGEAVAYVPLSQYGELDPALLEDLDRMSLVCLDDLHVVLGIEAWEMGVFSVYNGLRERGGRLLVTADQPQRRLAPLLPDLASRLSWGPGYQLRPLRDEQLLSGLSRLAEERGLVLHSETGRYLLNRCPRDMGYLQALLDKLDRASLAAQRRLTIPFVREVLSSFETETTEMRVGDAGEGR